MKKIFTGTLLLALLLLIPLSTTARADIDVHISVPPPIMFVEPPELIVLPGTYIYAVPDVEVDIFFYDGWWWRIWDNRWYRSREYNTGWVYYESVPTFYTEIPSDWRHYYRERRWRGQEWNYQRIPHHRVQRYWRDWERDRYWEHQDMWGVSGFILPSAGGVSAGIGFALPPPIEFVQPPTLVVLPGTYVYAVPEVEVDIFFCDGWWWRSWENRWYRSREYSSGWVYYHSVPSFYREIPSDWRRYYREGRWQGHDWHYQRIPHHRVQRYWRDWERDRYWEHQQSWGVRELQPRIRPQRSYKEVKPQRYRQQFKEGGPKHSQRSYREVQPRRYRLDYIDTGPQYRSGAKQKHYKQQGTSRSYKQKGYQKHYRQQGNSRYYKQKGNSRHYRQQGNSRYYKQQGNPQHYRQQGYQKHYRQQGNSKYYRQKGNSRHYKQQGNSRYYKQQGNTQHYRQKGYQKHYRQQGNPKQYKQMGKQNRGKGQNHYRW